MITLRLLTYSILLSYLFVFITPNRGIIKLIKFVVTIDDTAGFYVTIDMLDSKTMQFTLEVIILFNQIIN